MKATLKHQITRMLCSSIFLPVQIRRRIARLTVGDERESGGITFDVNFCGHRFYGTTNSHIDWHVYYFGSYDPVGLDLMKRIAEATPSAVALDVGANVGNHMLLLSTCCEHVHCFEPYPMVLPQLKRHVEANRLTNVTIHEFGLSAESKCAEYFENSEQNFGAGSFESDHENVKADASFSLELKKADSVFTDLRIQNFDLLKIDVEGHEISVLEGMAAALRESRPFVYMEHGPTTHKRVQCEAEFKTLFPSDYKFWAVRPSNRWTKATASLVPFDFSRNCNLLAWPEEKQAVIAGIARAGGAISKTPRGRSAEATARSGMHPKI